MLPRGTLLDQVQRREAHLVVERYGIPVAAVISFENAAGGWVCPKMPVSWVYSRLAMHPFHARILSLVVVVSSAQALPIAPLPERKRAMQHDNYKEKESHEDYRIGSR